MKISIVTVVYNAKENLEKTIRSVRQQTYSDIEFVVIDGASTDGTLDLIKKNKDLIDVIISEPDEGLYYAMNKGKDNAEGDFALFMNAGDEFVEETCIAEVARGIYDKDLLYYGNTIIFFDKTYRIAPKRHHQSVFFPKKFYKKNSYNADKFKVTAEGDYIYKALNQCKEKHLDVDIIYSKIDGFRVHRYNSIKGMRMMYKEVTSLMKEHSGRVPLSYKLNYPIKSFAKYLAFKIGGLPLVAKMLLNSYKEPTKTYQHH